MAKMDQEKLKEFEKQARMECCSDKTTAHHGGVGGRPFWNNKAAQFMYAPAFQFSLVPGCKKYRFTATDESGKEYSFEADTSRALLSPIWDRLPEGVTQLQVTTADDPDKTYPVGARTFFKVAPFSADLPQAKKSYRECAAKAFEYALSQGCVNYWLDHKTPDPTYDLNIYPSKILSSLISAMLAYAKICPEKKEDALKIAVNAAEYLLKITPGKDAPLPEIPPTYDLSFCPDPVACGIKTNNWDLAEQNVGTVMMLYPASVGSAYLSLYEVTGDKKYLEHALAIGRFYEEHQEAGGSWKLVYSEKTGKPLSENCVNPLLRVVPFLMELYKVTGEEKWKEAAARGVGYVEKVILPTYNWEGQFEDSPLSANYSNLSHYGPSALIRLYLTLKKDDPKAREAAADLMRFVEDQFVVWKRPAPWCGNGFDPACWHTPAGLEQYNWLVPIDASTVAIARTFLSMYEAGMGDIYLAKAMTLVDQVTLVQGENGRIETHWGDCDFARDNFWINCMFDAAKTLVQMADYDDQRDRLFR